MGGDLRCWAFRPENPLWIGPRIVFKAIYGQRRYGREIFRNLY